MSLFGSFHLRITQERFALVYEDISSGSEPALRFYIMVALSTMIASLGLITNSTAVVIGAMLVAPLMTPIFGISLGLVRGDRFLFGRAVRAEVIGVAAAVAMGFILGLLIPEMEPTPEMLARTRPNLFDLLVAVFAGAAGAYALIDEKISPALPGVAIATAIVPPLANAGLCLSLGAVGAGVGSFLLFFANFLSILLVASLMFIASGMARDHGTATTRALVRRFGPAALAFVLVASFLSHTLVQIVQERHLAKTVEKVVESNLADLQATGVDRLIHQAHEGQLMVMAYIHSPTKVLPRRIRNLQDTLTKATGMPTELVIRNFTTSDISAAGSSTKLVSRGLKGALLKTNPNPVVQKTVAIEQILRGFFEKEAFGLELYKVDYISLEDGPMAFAAVGGVRPLATEEIRSLEEQVRRELNDDALRLIVRFIDTEYFDAKGPLRYGWATGRYHDPVLRANYKAVEAAVAAAVEAREGFALVTLQVAQLEGTYHFMAEVVGPHIFPREAVMELEGLLRARHDFPIELAVLSRPEAVVTPVGYVPYKTFSRPFTDQQRTKTNRNLNFLLEVGD